jgi:hypothetical protein
VIRKFQGSLRVPAFLGGVPFFVVFSSRAMSLCRVVVLLSGSQVFLMRSFLACVGHCLLPSCFQQGHIGKSAEQN